MERNQFVLLDHCGAGHHAVCDTPDCGSRTPEYRLVIGSYARFLCERCFIDLALHVPPVHGAIPFYPPYEDYGLSDTG
jgi:hypothetical protein